MIFKRFLVIAFLLCFSVVAVAAETTISGSHGSWWNPEYAGEGFTFEQYDDGLVIVYWYTYDAEGNQAWLIGTGTMDGNRVVVDMIRTRGGLMASTQNPGLVEEEVWGTVTFELISCGEIDMSFESVDGQVGGYMLERIVREGLSGSLCDEPNTAKIKLQLLDAVGNWKDVEMPYKGDKVINKTYAGNDGSIRAVHLQFRLTSLDGEFVIVKTVADDPSGVTLPAVEGVVQGQVIQDGDYVVFRLVSDLTGNLTVHQNYQLLLRDIGEVVNINIHLTTN